MWILIVIAWGAGPTNPVISAPPTMHEFYNQEHCEIARDLINEVAGAYKPKPLWPPTAYCVGK